MRKDRVKAAPTVRKRISHDGCITLHPEEAIHKGARQRSLVALFSAKPARGRMVGMKHVLAVVGRHHLRSCVDVQESNEQQTRKQIQSTAKAE